MHCIQHCILYAEYTWVYLQINNDIIRRLEKDKYRLFEKTVRQTSHKSKQKFYLRKRIEDRSPTLSQDRVSGTGSTERPETTNTHNRKNI